MTILKQILEKLSLTKKLLVTTILCVGTNTITNSHNLAVLNDSITCVNLLRQADSLLNVKQYSNSIDKAISAFNLASKNNFPTLLLKSNTILGDAYSNEHKTEVSLRHYLSALSIAEKINSIPNIISINKKIGDVLFEASAYEKALEYYKKAYQVSPIQSFENRLLIQENIGLCYQKSLKKSEAIIEYDSIIAKTENRPNSSIRTRVLFYLSDIHRDIGNWDKAISNCQKLYTCFKDDSDQYGMALMMNNIGFNLISKGDYKGSIDAFKTALNHAKQSNTSDELTIGILTNIGICYQNISESQKARESIEEAITIAEANKDWCKKAYLQNLIALIYYRDGDLYNAHEFSRLSIETLGNAKCKDVLQENYKTYSIILRDGNDYINALSYYEKYLKIKDSVLFEKRINEQKLSDQLALLKETESKQQLFIADQQMKDMQVRQLKLEAEKNEQQISLLQKEKELEQSEKNRLFQSLELSKKEHEAVLHQTTIRDLEQKNAIKELEIKQKEAQEKDRQKEIALLQSEKERQQLEIDKQAEARKRVTWMLVLSGMIIVLVVISYIVTKKKNSLLAEQKQVIQDKNLYLEEANQNILEKNTILSEQSEEIRAQNEEITTQKELIEKKNEDITDSILYARVIQTAILTEEDTLNTNFSDHFILYRPKDIVSGDFWWFEKANDKFIVAVADCTGHGVPGAFLSMLGVAYLHEIISIYPEIRANELLFELRKMVVDSLKSSPTRDGMDIALCIFDFEKREVDIAAANNSVYIIQNGEINIIKADKMPIGNHPLMNKPYTLNQLKFQSGDKFYLFTDGYADQFGGEDGRKLKMSIFRDYLLKSSSANMSTQKEWLEQELDIWKKNREQVDDILVIGLTI